jgi:hypothetical protein
MAPLLITFPVVHWHRVLQGCFITPPLTLIIGTSFYWKWHPPSAFCFGVTFHTFSATLLCPKMYPSFAHELKLLTILFLRYLLMHLPFNEPLPITYAQGIKLGELVPFMRVRVDGKGQAVYSFLSAVQVACHFPFAIVRSGRGPKRKIIRMILKTHK